MLSRGLIVAIIIVLIILACITGLFFLFGHYFHAAEKVCNKVPPPTGMNQNFLIQVNDCFIPTAAAYGYTLRITAGFRSMSQQEQIYQSGRTEDGHIISEAPPGHSLHNYGYAVDVTDRWRGYNINWDELIKIGEFCGLESGGTGDLPHFEHRGGLTTDDFACGMRPKPLILPCNIMATRASAKQPLTIDDLKTCGAQDIGGIIPSEILTEKVFNKNLSLGVVDPDVQQLQIYLNINGFLVANTGAGSPGNETNEFGYGTQAALIRFQQANKISGSGWFGPVTRTFVNSSL